MTIKAKVLSALGLAGVAFLTLATFYTMASRQTDYALRRIVVAHAHQLQIVEYANALTNYEHAIASRAVIGTCDGSQCVTARKDLTVALGKLEAALDAELAPLNKADREAEDDEIERVGVIRQLTAELMAAEDHMATLLANNDAAGAQDVYVGTVQRIVHQQLTPVLLAGVTGETEEVIETEHQAVADQERFKYLSTLASVLLVGFTIAMGLFIARAINRPIRTLTDGVERFRSGDLKHRIPLNGRDEMSLVAAQLNRMAENIERQHGQLEAAHAQLLQAWEAGVAEVAGGVLHNIGNVLNSINVSVTMLREELSKSKALTIGLVAERINKHADDLPQFLTESSQGRALPTFLNELARCVSEEQQSYHREIESLSTQVEHIKKIIDIHKSYAKRSDIEQSVSLTEIVEDAIQLCGGLTSTRGVSLTREFNDTPRITVDRHKLLQVLINLLRNAKHAVRDADRPDGQVTVRTERVGDDAVRVSIVDNGVGVAASDMPHVFEHGFTTKSGGSGFGLHSSRLAAQVLGGTLDARSDGPGCGASFMLELPVEPTRTAHA